MSYCPECKSQLPLKTVSFSLTEYVCPQCKANLLLDEKTPRMTVAILGICLCFGINYLLWLALRCYLPLWVPWVISISIVLIVYLLTLPLYARFRVNSSPMKPGLFRYFPFIVMIIICGAGLVNKFVTPVSVPISWALLAIALLLLAVFFIKRA